MNAFFLSALTISLAALPAAAADSPVSGKWQIHMSISGNESDQTCTFSQNGVDLTGNCESNQGTVKISGKVEEKKVSWSFKSEYNGSPLTVSYIGTLDSGKIAGSVSVPEYGVDGEFTAIQSK